DLPFMTSFSVDGISTERTRGGGPSRELFPSVESIAEFKVSEANNNAEFMQVTDLTTTTKSGSNVLHGTGFWFLQDSKFTGVTRFTPRDASGEPIKPKVQAKSFGASAGGPIVRNKTFFFATYEGVRRPNEVTLSQLVPPDAFRTGDLSGISRQIVNPFTGQPYPNNQIPINASSAKILETLYERQNQATGAALNRPNYIVNAPGDFAVDGWDVRVDHSFSPSQKVFARFTYKNLDTIGPTSGSFNTRQGTPFARTDVRQIRRASVRRVPQLDSKLEPPARTARRVRQHARDQRLPARRAGRGPHQELQLHGPASHAAVRRHSGLRLRRWHVHRDRWRQ